MTTQLQASQPLQTTVAQRVAMVSLNNGPVNALGGALRAALLDSIDQYDANPDVDAIIIMAEGPVFSVGVDLGVFGKARKAAPTLAVLCRRIETCKKPVVALLPGPAHAAGAQLALSAHYRLAVPGTTIAFTEISMGLLPGGGGTQRLTRLVGADAALRMMLSGKPVPAETAQSIGLIDAIVRGDAGPAAHAFALGVVREPLDPRRSEGGYARIGQASEVIKTIAATRKALGPKALMAATSIVDCVEAALLLPYEAALEFELAAFEDCFNHPQSIALRHIFQAERRVAKELLTLDDTGKRRPTEAGQALVAQLFSAQDRAIAWLVGQGISEDAIDRAFVDWGFGTGPFGGTVSGPVDDRVRHRVLGALLAEGARLLDAGKVARAGDVDALAIYGMGYPRRDGGPMRAAQTAGLTRMLRALRDWVAEDRVWEPSTVLVRAAQVAAGFDAVSAQDNAHNNHHEAQEG
ncbi:enoyl-CoA hydratase-related protein [Flavimaricola sp.]|nr:enoyl-CoA hydratase-related protein [Flavimaricola sp.]MDA9019842.1 enoyl-CoA hydratase-related protein [Flavimaricola sp.]